MINKNVLKAGVAALALGGALSPLSIVPIAHAQNTTSSVRGVITDANGSPLSGATVTVTDTRNGSSQTSVTNESGTYFA
ncbi:MAG: carboxypeptidase-like regulatory domain-containing protein, partial [Pseudomonadota bacterium]